MKYKLIRYVRKSNLGNYETQDIDITVEVGDNENIDEIFLKLKRKVLEFGGHGEKKNWIKTLLNQMRKKNG